MTSTTEATTDQELAEKWERQENSMKSTLTVCAVVLTSYLGDAMTASVFILLSSAGWWSLFIPLALLLGAVMVAQIASGYYGFAHAVAPFTLALLAAPLAAINSNKRTRGPFSNLPLLFHIDVFALIGFTMIFAGLYAAQMDGLLTISLIYGFMWFAMLGVMMMGDIHREDKTILPFFLPPPQAYGGMFMYGLVLYAIIATHTSPSDVAKQESVRARAAISDHYTTHNAYPASQSDGSITGKINLANPHYFFYANFYHYERIDSDTAFLVYVTNPHESRSDIYIFDKGVSTSHYNVVVPGLDFNYLLSKFTFEAFFEDRLAVTAAVVKRGVITGSYKWWKKKNES